MGVPDWFWFFVIFTVGCCIGSFLNVVVYRLPREKSIITPPSVCPKCGELIRFYDNIPLVSWLFLGAKCRYCRNPISPRYFVIELLTGLTFLLLFILYFRVDLRAGLGHFWNGGWLIYLVHIILLAAFIAASAIDLELKVIPLSICWFVTVTGVLGSALVVYVIEPAMISGYDLLPTASCKTGSLAAGAFVGLGISLMLISSGLLKRSYEVDERTAGPDSELTEPDESRINHRLEICREILFLMPIVICSFAAYWFLNRAGPVHGWWVNFSQYPAISGVLGSLWGYFVGCGVVWTTRILGTIGFGKEAMGLGDVHLMGAAGAVTGWAVVVVAFFIAPFFGLAWAGLQMFFKKTRQIPYGPFLSLGIFVAMILHDGIFSYLIIMFYH